MLNSIDKGIAISSLGDPKADEHFCLKLRMYVVAPDSKGSDSVHPVRYTTCQPASQYGLKTTVERKIERPGASQPVTLQY